MKTLDVTHTDLVKQWDEEKNLPLLPHQVTHGSHKNAWWKCEEGHSWSARISSRTTGNGCPVCAGKQVLQGFNDLASCNPRVSSEWNYLRNSPLLPSQVTSKSSKKVWWKCEKGHEWQTSIANRVRLNNNCPYCNGRSLIPGKTDLLSKFPEHAKEWHPTKNGSLLPSEVFSSSSYKKLWWKCEKGHEWQMTAGDKVRPRGCPVCSNVKVVAGVNDLATVFPEIADEWHMALNEDLAPTQVTYGSNRKVWWTCSKASHSYEKEIVRRTVGKSECYKCNPSTSLPEIEINEFINALGLKTLQNSFIQSSTGKKFELDILVKDKNVAIEFNGLYWHSEDKGKAQNYHYDKWATCREQGLQLIQIWEDDWRDRKAIIKSMLAFKLGVSKEAKLPARNTYLCNLDKEDIKEFLDKNHIQGFASGTYYLGLKNREAKLMAVLVLKKEAGEIFNIIRYATSAQVQGGFTKLLRYAEKIYKPTKFVTFSDNTVSDGGLYESNGFTATKQLPPDYMYVVKGERKHKFGYRLKKFKNDPGLLWEDGLSEKELALLNNLPRIWDAGKTKWEKLV